MPLRKNVNYSRNDFQIWKQALLRPDDIFAKEKPNATLRIAIQWAAMSGFLFGLIRGMLTFNLVGGIIAGFFLAVGFSIGILFYSAIIYVVAKIAGGTGTFTEQTYLFSLYQSPLLVITAMVGIILLVGKTVSGFAAISEGVYLLAELVLGLFGLFLLTKAIKVAHNLETSKAVLAWLVPTIAAIALMYGFIQKALVAVHP